MSQHDYVIANGTGAAVRSDLNGALAAIVSNNSGATAPSTTYAYQWWADTTTGLLKLRNAANNAWITLFQLDGEWSTLAVENGSASAPSIYFKDSGTDTGIYSPGADQLALSTNGTGRLFVDSSGQVGVGAAPAKTLDVTGSVIRIKGTSTAQVSVEAASGSSSWIYWRETGVADRGILGFANGSGDLVYRSNSGDFSTGTERFRITQAGLVGIGTTSPVQQFVVSNGGANGLEFVPSANSGTTSYIASYNRGTSLYSDWRFDAAAFRYEVSGIEAMRVDSSRRLLVGTSSAGAGASTTTTIIGALLMKSTGLKLISQGGTLDLDLSEGTGIVGHLYVSSTRDSNAAARTNATYFISTRQGNNTAITLLNSNNGSTSGSSFTITNPSANIFRFTDTAAGGSVDVSMSFVGTIAF